MATTQQPGAGGGAQWATAGAAPAGCPEGLEFLASTDTLMVRQQVELFEAFTGYETNNKYEILNLQGQRVYYAAEDTNCCTRQCCGNGRPFEIQVNDNRGREVIHLHRPCKCSSCWFPCCLQKVTVSSPPDTTIGYVKQAWSPCNPKFYIQDAEGNTVLVIKGPCLSCAICGDVEFEVLAPDGENQVGRISKQWSGLAKEIFTDADNFGIGFPRDLDVKMKACMLGACFLIDFMYFETTKNDKPGIR